MRRFLTALIVLFTLLWLPAGAQDARAALDAAAAAMGASTLHAVEYLRGQRQRLRPGPGARPRQAVASIHRDPILAARQLRRRR